jgi:cysteine desulfurase
MTSIYLDHQATTPVDPRVREAMHPFLGPRFGNAASGHSFGASAAAELATARRRVAALIGSSPSEIVFTSGATESNNLAIKGLAEASIQGGRNHLVVASTEHPSVLDTCGHLATTGFEVSYLDVSTDGEVKSSEIEAALRPSTFLISIMAANNEVGTLAPVQEIGGLAREHGVAFHCDAAQAIGKIPIDVLSAEVDLLSMSAHKVYGPQGVGALFVRRGLRPRPVPQIHGGGHESGLRSGTANLAGCVGFGLACEIAAREMSRDSEHLTLLGRHLLDGLQLRVPEVQLNGPDDRLPGNLSVTFPGVPADVLMARCPRLAVSTGSACSSAVPTPSHVLKAIGLTDEQAECTIRIGLGRFTTESEIEAAIDQLATAVLDLRELGLIGAAA